MASGEAKLAYQVAKTLSSVIPGWSEGPDPESRDSGFDASHRPGMTETVERLSQPRVCDTDQPDAEEAEP
jgi:hypothetical protein